jgi:hypothetical protein
MDDATGHLLPGAACVPAEDTVRYLRLLRTLVGTCGIPVALCMDLHGIFRRNDATWTVAEELQGAQEPTQVGRALAALGIEAIYALSPQAKGRIGRLWGTFQDRRVAELRLAGICTVEAANAFLVAFTARFKTRFGRPAADSVPAWRPVPRGLDLARICSVYIAATVLNDNTVRTQGQTLQIPPGPGGGATRRRAWRCATCSTSRGGSTAAIGSWPRTPPRLGCRRIACAVVTTMAPPAVGVTFSRNNEGDRLTELQQVTLLVTMPRQATEWRCPPQAAHEGPVAGFVLRSTPFDCMPAVSLAVT